MGWSRTSLSAAATALDDLLERAPRPLEELLTERDAFGLVTASPLQRAICRLADGAPLRELAQHPTVLSAIGDCTELRSRPRELYIVSGSRVGKTLFSAAAAVRMSQTVDVSQLGPGDEPRIPILSLDRDKAHACYLHLTETLRARPRLRELVVREGTNELGAPAVWLRHPTGRPVMVCVAAGKRAGNAVVSYFLAGCIFDEFCKMQGADEAIVNFDDSRRNALGRLLPGAMLLAIGSPWAPFGPAYAAVQTHHRRPTTRLVVVRARGRDMNPAWWTPERIASLPEEVARTEEGAEFLDEETQLVAGATLARCTRAEPLEMPRVYGATYVAAMDPATRGNAWTLVVGTRIGERRVIACAREWRGSPSKPLDPEEVLAEVAAVLSRYGLDWVETDQWATDALRVIARGVETEDGRPIRLVEWPATSAENTEMYLDLRTRLDAGEVELPPVPALREDILRLRKRTTQAGVAVVLPKTSDGRHCDFAPALARVVRRELDDVPASPPQAGTRAAVDAEQREAFEAARKRYGRKPERPWWRR